MVEPEQSQNNPDTRIETGTESVSKDSKGAVSTEEVEAGLRREADQKLAGLERANNARAAEAGVDIDNETAVPSQPDNKKDESFFGPLVTALVAAKDSIWDFLGKTGGDFSAWLKKFFGIKDEEGTDFGPDRMFPDWEKSLENPNAPVFSFPKGVAVDVTDVKRYREHHAITGKGRWHKGYDISIPEGTPIVATAKGKIISSHYNKHIDPDTGKEDGGGWLVTLRTEDGKEHKFMHLQEQGLTKNALVVPGMILGLVGQTGGATGPHLHYEVWNQSTPEEPMAYLSADLQASAEDERKNKGLPPLA